MICFFYASSLTCLTNNAKKVYNGMEVVRAIEKAGSDSGKTKKKVLIVDCGQI